MIVKQIIGLVPPRFRKRGWKVIASVPIRAMLDLAGVAALLPVLLLVLEPGNITADSVLGQLYRRGNFSSAYTFTVTIGGVVLAVILIKSLLNIGLTAYQSHYLLDLYRHYSRQLFSRWYNKGLLFVKDKNSMDLGHGINYVCYAFALNVLSPLLSLAGEALLLLFLFTALVVYAPLTAILVPLCFVPVVWIYMRLLRNRLRDIGEKENESKRRQTRIVQEAFRGYAEIEVNKAFPLLEKQFEHGLTSISSCRTRIEILLRVPGYLMEIGIAACMALLIVLSKGESGDALRVTFGVFAVAALRMLPAVRSIVNNWVLIRNNLYCLETIQEIGGPVEPEKGRQPGKELRFKECIEIKKLTFGFPGSPSLISDLSLTIHKGECLGIQGSSGIGKTTLFNLLLGFYPPAKGSIAIDGMPLTPENHRGWLDITGYVPQDVFIIEGSLAENIALGVEEKDIDREKIREILTQVSLSQFADQLPQGIDTPLGENGNRLSGGQKQRIGIARALYKEAEILFFDEATSSLDRETEEEINRSIRELSETRKELTLIIIAHRESSLAFCDRIIHIHSTN